MDVHAEAFWLPKYGSSEAEYEDFFGPTTLKSPQGFKGQRMRFAVADGATEASFSKQWAKQLVRAFVHGQLSVPPTAEELKPLQERWQKYVHRRPLPWYTEEKAEEGAFSSLLGLEIFESVDGKATPVAWRAVAAGDSCLFKVERGRVLEAWPIAKSVEFGNSPSLLSSIAASNGADLAGARVQKAEGGCGQDTAFYLMTDALSCWFLREQERGREPWRILADLGTERGQSFPRLVRDLRATGELKNDDVTLLRIDVLG
jgi:hypothetical protein